MKIGQLAAATQVSVRSLRYYEIEGLLTPARSASGHRLYDGTHLTRVRWIQDCFAAGLCSSGIRALLAAASAERRGAIDEVIEVERRRLRNEAQAAAKRLMRFDGLAAALRLE